jgi:iron complex outermembrane receptor protein
LFYYDSTYHQAADSALAPAYFGAPLPPSFVIFSGTRDMQEATSAAAFGQVDWDVTSAVSLSLGGRVTADYKRFLGEDLTVTNIDFANATPLGAAFSGTETSNVFTPRASVQYKFTPDINAYALYSRGYNAGGFNGRGTDAAQIGPFKPEFVNNYELGLKSEFLDHRLRLNATGYLLDFSNKQQSVLFNDPLFGSITLVRNVAAERIEGAEFEVTAVPLHGLTIDGSFSYLHAKFENFVAQIQSGEPITNNTGLVPVRSPKFTAGVESSYVVPVGENSLTFDARSNYVDAYFIDPLNDPRSLVKQHTDTDLSVSYDMAFRQNYRLRLQAFVNNVSDENHLVFFSTASNGIDFQSTSPPRTFGAEVQLKF